MSERISDEEFQSRAEKAIADLEAAYSRLADDRDIDVEVEGGVLTVTFEEGEPGRFIISPNAAVRQLWVSARVASYKFDWSEEAEDFLLAGSDEPSRAVLERLTREQLGDESVTLQVQAGGR